MNIYDIAEKAGVSIATVSRVINNNGYVGKTTRQKILNIISENKYTPSKAAQNLSAGASFKLIGIICCNIEDMYYAKAVSVLERELSGCGYDIILSCTGESREERQKSVDMLISKNADAIIFIGSVFAGKSEDVIKNAARYLPVFIINADVKGANIHCAYCDESEALISCVSALFFRGVRKILYLYDAETYSGSKKLTGFNNGIKQYGLQGVVLKCGKDALSAFSAFTDFVKTDKTDAVICSNDLLAAGVLKAAAACGLKVTENLSVIGFNNSVICGCTPYRLSSVENNVEKLAVFTARNINDYFTTGKAQADYKTDFELIIRET